MNIAVIFAGGTGTRMHSGSTPKQFLDADGKPILVHTALKFENSTQIDRIVIVSLKDYIDYVYELVKKYNITKVAKVVAGGQTGQESIFAGLTVAHELSVDEKDVVLIHDGVRPLIDIKTIDKNVEMVKKHGSAITTTKAIETIVMLDDSLEVKDIMDRNKCNLARAPQSFFLKDIYSCHLKAKEENKNDFIDSATMMSYFGFSLHVVEGPIENIKITTAMDYVLFKALLKEGEKNNG